MIIKNINLGKSKFFPSIFFIIFLLKICHLHAQDEVYFGKKVNIKILDKLSSKSKLLKIALESAKIKSELIPVRNGGHGKNVFKEEFQNKMVMFFKKELNKYTINE